MRAVSPRLLGSLAVASLIGLAGCGSATTSPSSSSGSGSGATNGGSNSGGSGTSASSLLPQSAAAQISGDPGVTQQAGSGAAGAGTSLVTYADTSNGASATLLIENIPGGIAQTELQAALGQAGNGSNANVQTLSGVGDQGLKDVEQNSASVVFSKGNTLVVIGATNELKSGADLEPNVGNLARQIAGQV